MIDLKAEPSYSFNASPADDPGRFLLHFKNKANGAEEIEANIIQIYSYDKDVYVVVPEFTKGTIKVYNLMGQEIVSTSIQSTINKIALNNSSYYIVKVLSEKGMVTKKVFIK